MYGRANFDLLRIRVLAPPWVLHKVRKNHYTATYMQQDLKVLELAVQEERFLLTHDRAIWEHYTARLAKGHSLPAIFIVDTKADPGRVLEELFLVVELDEVERYAGLIWYVPGL